MILSVLLAGCAEGHGLVVPPPEFDHPFCGRYTEAPWPASQRPFGIFSVAQLHVGGSRPMSCDVKIAAEASGEFREQLRRVERANCNGWFLRDGDVNYRRGF